MSGFFLLALLGQTLALSAPVHAGPDTSDAWLLLEQKSIERTVDPLLIVSPDIQNQKELYRPEAGNWFKVKTLWIPESELDVAAAESRLPPDLRSEFVRVQNGVRQYRLFVHPESEG